MGNRETAFYLYCLTPGGCGIPASAVGVDGQRPVSVRVSGEPLAGRRGASGAEALLRCDWQHGQSRVTGEIDAVLSEVELGEFCGEAAEARLQDLAWLGPRACRHAAVIEEVMRRTPVLPARFATLFTSLDRLQQTVLDRREAIAGFFAQLGDKQEWAVKGLLDRAGALRGLGSPAPPEPAPAASPGARYFQEKRLRAQVERDFGLRLKGFCRRAAAALGAQASGFRERKTLGVVTAETDAEVVFNWAFLVAPAALEDFRMRLDQFNGEEGFPGLYLTLTGPWPPYSFAPDLSGVAAA